MAPAPDKSLSETTLQELSLEELAMEFDHVVDYETGKVQRIGKVDRKELRRQVMELNKKGREAMKPFMDWQTERYGSTGKGLETRALAVWRMLCERPTDPSSFLLDRERYTHVERVTLRKQLTRFAAFLIEEAERPEDIDYGKSLANRLLDVPATRKLREQSRKATKKKTVPLTEEQIQKILRVVEKRSIDEGPRKPWYRPLMRFMILAGQTGQYDFVTCEKETWLRVVEEYEEGKPAALPVWGTRNKSKLVPVHLVYEEMKQIANWPFPWGQISNIVAPTSQVEIDKSARRILGAEVKDACAEAGIHSRGVAFAIRNAAIKRLWDATHDYILMQSMFGIDVSDFKRLDFLDIQVPTFKK
jgi:hypothetical protein